MLKLLERVNSELGVTVVVITHEMDVVRAIANRVAVLDDGHLVEVGSAFDVFSAPRADTTRRFVETALQDKPEPEDATRLRATYEARLVSIQIGQNNHLGTVLTDAVRRSDVHFEIVFGGITALQGRSFGNITLALSGSQDAVDQLIADLRARTGVEEIA